MFKIATWNVNSIRVRLPHVLAWLEMAKPDVLALQEIKVLTEEFPQEAFLEAGYHSIASGQKTYNGVAVLSKSELDLGQEIIADFPDFPGFPGSPSSADPQRRILGLEINNIFVLNLYVPNGSEVGSEKYAYKLGWLESLYKFLIKKLKETNKIIILGDFNIAPRDQDVHDPAAWEGKILVSSAERAALQKIINLGFVDSFAWAPEGDTVFSWWDYRGGGFQRDHGMRIDHVLVSSALVPQLSSCTIDKDPRSCERPSDHVPVIASLISC